MRIKVPFSKNILRKKRKLRKFPKNKKGLKLKLDSNLFIKGIKRKKSKINRSITISEIINMINSLNVYKKEIDATSLKKKQIIKIHRTKKKHKNLLKYFLQRRKIKMTNINNPFSRNDLVLHNYKYNRFLSNLVRKTVEKRKIRKKRRFYVYKNCLKRRFRFMSGV